MTKSMVRASGWTLATSLPTQGGSLRQRAKSEVIPPKRRTAEPLLFSDAIRKTQSQCLPESSADSIRQAGSNQVSVSLFNESVDMAETSMAEDADLPSPSNGSTDLLQSIDSSPRPKLAFFMLERERAEKVKLQAALKEQMRLHEFEKSTFLSQFEEEREAMRGQKEQLLCKLKNAQVYERALIKDLKMIAGERDLLKQHVEVFKQRDAANVRPGMGSTDSTGAGMARRVESGGKRNSDVYTRHIKAYARSLRQHHQPA